GRSSRPSAGDDLQVDLRRDLRVQPHRGGVRAGGLDVPRQLDPAPVQLGAAGRPDRLDDVRRGDRAEQPTAGPGPGGQPDLPALDRGPQLLGLAEVPNVPRVAGPADLADLLLATLGPVDRQAAGHQVVTPVPVLDLDDVAGGAEPADLLGEDELHVHPLLAGRAGVGQQCHLPAGLHRGGDVALVLRAVAGHPAGPDLAAVGGGLAAQRGVLVVDVTGLVLAERANLLLGLADRWFRHLVCAPSVQTCSGAGSERWLVGEVATAATAAAGRRGR